MVIPLLVRGAFNSDTECMFTKYGTSYRGTKTGTRSGRTCQRWDTNSPHAHVLTSSSMYPDADVSDAANYCRNPGGYRQGGVWCFTTDADVVWEYCDVPRCDCRTTKAGSDYMGQVAVTERNETCQRWDSQRPHGHTYVNPNQYPENNVTLANNYCRNPATWWEEGVWCYTTNPAVRWRHCDIQFCECKMTEEGLNYMGKLNVTVSGRACQRWDAQSPHEHTYTDESAFPDSSIAEANNYCRNPDDETPGGPWCYTTDSSVRWEYCRVPKCENTEEYLTTTTVMPSTTTFTGPTVSQHAVTETVGVSVQECKFTKMGTSYKGHMSHTVTGKTCQRWDTQQPHRHEYTDIVRYPDASLQEAANFCRNPNGRSEGPWCYTSDANTEWEYCDVPICDCRITKFGVLYTGTISTTISGYTCQRWDRQNPHRHPVTDNAMFADGDVSKAENYCRNFNRGVTPALHPWCFTTNINKRFEFCSVPHCECKYDSAGLEYMGRISKTAEGKTCMRWDSQSPHTHNYLDDTMFPDGSVAAAENFCRNPDDMETGGPWCYTTDPNVRWQYCDIPKCELDNPYLSTTPGVLLSSIISTVSSTMSLQSSFAITERHTVFPGKEIRPLPKDREIECKLTERGQEYTGTVSHTRSFRACQQWSLQSPHAHSYTNDSAFPGGIAAAGSYCRNPNGVKIEGPWCYTEDPSTEWEYCDVSYCACRQSRAGWEYNGTVTRTVSGKDCQRWDKQVPHTHKFYDSASFPDRSVSAANNYCRNPDKWNPKGPWCYTTDPSVEWEYCNIPFCECKSTPGGHEYGGKVAVTSTGRSCQSWASQYPHNHRYYESRNFPEDAVDEAQNYCRNPEPDDHKGPWCFTTDPSTRWEYCDIQLCELVDTEPSTLAQRGLSSHSQAGAIVGGVLGGISACMIIILIAGLLLRRLRDPALGWTKEYLKETPMSKKHEEVKVPPMAEKMDPKHAASFDNPIYSCDVVYEKDKSDSTTGEDNVTLNVKNGGETEA